jgi:hypothetical protein
MAADGSSVTLIFYRVGDAWWKEPALNLVAAAAQLSSLTHVELAIGEAAGECGMMSNVIRIFNDERGAELTQRTGRNPSYQYLSLGCSKMSEQRMLAFARKQVGKPFSNYGMAMSLLMPRTCTDKDFFCAELVARVLQEGGLLSADSNPSAATPYSLFTLYNKQAAATANPFTLRTFKKGELQFHAVGSSTLHKPQLQLVPTKSSQAGSARAVGVQRPAPTPAPSSIGARRACDSPPRATFRALNQKDDLTQKLTLSFHSLRSDTR